MISTKNFSVQIFLLLFLTVVPSFLSGQEATGAENYVFNVPGLSTEERNDGTGEQ